MTELVTYRSEELHKDRFDRRTTSTGLFEIDSYMKYQGTKLTKRFDVLTINFTWLIQISVMMDFWLNLINGVPY